MAALFDTGIFSVLTSAGAIDPGATLDWYVAGTTTRVDTYTTAAASVANANPVVADANGRFGQIWLTNGTYKYVLKSSAGSTLKTVDNFYADTQYDAATAAEIRAGTATNRAYTPAGVIAALAPVTITYSATTTIDFSTLINGAVTLTGNVTFANPTVAAGDVGKSGRLKIIQDGTGSRTAAYGSNYLFDGGTDFVLSTAASAADYIYYDIESTTRIVLSPKRGVA